MADMHETLARIDERTSQILDRIESIPRDCAKHEAEIKGLATQVDSLWNRWWWAISTGFSALVAALLAAWGVFLKG